MASRQSQGPRHKGQTPMYHLQLSNSNVMKALLDAGADFNLGGTMAGLVFST